MIGQEHLFEIWETMIQDDTVPRFSIIAGDRGSGKKTFVKFIQKRLQEEQGIAHYILGDIKIDDVRDMIEASHKLKKICFCIYNADAMSLPAKNAMLKVIEECPNDNYFIMTLEDVHNTLSTIRSRARVYDMEPYTSVQIEEFAGSIVGHSDDIDIIKSVCETPGDAQLLIKTGARDFYYYVEKVVDNIAGVSLSNSFKIGSKVGIDGDEDKYDLKLFWKMFSKVCMDRAMSLIGDIDTTETLINYSIGVKITSKALSQLRTKGINKQMLFDKWLLDIREEWK